MKYILKFQTFGATLGSASETYKRAFYIHDVRNKLSACENKIAQIEQAFADNPDDETDEAYKQLWSDVAHVFSEELAQKYKNKCNSNIVLNYVLGRYSMVEDAYVLVFSIRSNNTTENIISFESFIDDCFLENKHV